MFCYQCQEASKGTGCTSGGVCGKSNTVSDIQDLAIYGAKGLAYINEIANKEGVEDKEVNEYLLKTLFMTITNANYDEKAIRKTDFQRPRVKRTDLKRSF